MNRFHIKQGDTVPIIQTNLVGVGGAVPVIAGSTIRFHLRQRGATVAQVDGLADIDDAPTALVSYEWQPGDTDTAGLFLAEWKVTYAGGEIETFPNDESDDVLIVGSLVSAMADTIACSVGRVAALIPFRTADTNGDLQGTFTSTTVPTDANVTNAIVQVAVEVAGRVGAVPVALVDYAQRVVALGAATQVERAFFPDMGLAANSPGNQLYEWYEQALAGLKTAVKNYDDTGDSTSTVMSPRWSFPDPELSGAISWWTRF